MWKISGQRGKPTPEKEKKKRKRLSSAAPGVKSSFVLYSYLTFQTPASIGPQSMLSSLEDSALGPFGMPSLTVSSFQATSTSRTHRTKPWASQGQHSSSADFVLYIRVGKFFTIIQASSQMRQIGIINIFFYILIVLSQPLGKFLNLNYLLWTFEKILSLTFLR